MFVCYYLTYYRNFHPDAEHGVAEWADVPKTAKAVWKGEEPVTCLSKNITVNAKVLPNMHILILGGSGDGKTTSLLILILTSEYDKYYPWRKGDLLNYGGYLKKKGMAVKSLNFKRYGTIRPVWSIQIHRKLYRYGRTHYKYPDICKAAGCPKGDPFWDDGVGLYLQSLFEYEWLQAKEEEGQPLCWESLIW